MKKLFYQGLCFLSIVLFLASSMLTAYSLAMSKAVFAHCLVGGVFLIIGLSLSIRYSQFMALNQSVVGIEPDNAKSIELHRNWERLFVSEFLNYAHGGSYRGVGLLDGLLSPIYRKYYTF